MVVVHNCEICGKTRRVRRAKGTSKPRFCSLACKGQWQHLNLRGPAHPRWRSDIPRTLKCERCDHVFATGSAAGLARAQGRRFCGPRCGPGFKWKAGTQHPRWSGGPEARKARGARSRSCLQQRDWSRAVLRRDNYTCQFCGQHGGDLHADHIKPYAEYPELRWDLGNGRTLCKRCHYTTFRRLQKTA
jgi:hypothetical protein